MDIAGSATATLIAQVVSLVALLVHLHRKRHPLFLHADERRYLRPDRAYPDGAREKGLPMGLQMIVLSGSSVVMIEQRSIASARRPLPRSGAAVQLWNYIMMRRARGGDGGVGDGGAEHRRRRLTACSASPRPASCST